MLWEGAFPTIRVASGRCPIYSVRLLFLNSVPPPIISLSPYAQVFNQDFIPTSPAPDVSIHCFILTLQDEAAKKKKCQFLLALNVRSPLMILIRSGLMLVLSAPRQGNSSPVA